MREVWHTRMQCFPPQGAAAPRPSADKCTAFCAGPNYGPTNEAFLQQIGDFYQAQANAYLQKGSLGWFQWSYRNPNGVWSLYYPLFNKWITRADVLWQP